MLDKLKSLKKRYEELSALLAQPETMNDQKRYRELAREHAQLSEIVAAYDRYTDIAEQLADCREMLSEQHDPEMRELIHAELSALEASFGADLLRMYQRYAERHGFKTEFLNETMTEMGGVKEVVLSLSGQGAYSRMKYESGVHRVQRVPETESQGRIHTSAATVAVLPEADDVEVDINPNDLQIDTYRSGGAGGQHVNKTESAIRITHLPTGLVVQCQDERSQHKNKEKAMRVLKSRLLELYQSQAAEAEATNRKNQVGSGDRSERIRTYNFPQNRVTDHRIGLTLYKLEAFMDGDMDELIDALILAERTAQLSGEGSETK